MTSGGRSHKQSLTTARDVRVIRLSKSAKPSTKSWTKRNKLTKLALTYNLINLWPLGVVIFVIPWIFTYLMTLQIVVKMFCEFQMASLGLRWLYTIYTIYTIHCAQYTLQTLHILCTQYSVQGHKYMCGCGWLWRIVLRCLVFALFMEDLWLE